MSEYADRLTIGRALPDVSPGEDIVAVDTSSSFSDWKTYADAIPIPDLVFSFPFPDDSSFSHDIVYESVPNWDKTNAAVRDKHPELFKLIKAW